VEDEEGDMAEERPEVPARPARVLIVEDDPDMRDTLLFVLSEEGYEVRTAASLAEALDLLDQRAFELVLTDLFDSGGENPLRTVEELRLRAQPTPVAVMTGWNMDARAVEEAGYAFLLAKPYDLEFLMARVAQCVHPPRPER
jgi:CheY-like chemotaxis protein